MKDHELVRAFSLNNAVISAKVNSVTGDIRKSTEESLFDDKLVKPFIPQIAYDIRQNAAQMASYYRLFFMLENHLRTIIESLLRDQHGLKWWDLAVPPGVQSTAQQNKSRELEAGFSLRSPDMLPYTNFGELGEIVRENWDVFGQVFRDRGHFNRVMFSLNLLRATIAHCGVLSEDEVLRLKLTFRDWFRLME